MAKQILICDDELHIISAVSFKLRKGGYTVVSAKDGEEAWDRIQSELPDLLITDYCMPRLDGLQLCQRIRECPSTKDLPIFMLTAKSLEADLTQTAERMGVLGIITKPFSPRDLMRRVGQATGHRIPVRG